MKTLTSLMLLLLAAGAAVSAPEKNAPDTKAALRDPAALTETSDGAGLYDGQRHPFLRLTDGTHPLATPP